MEAEVARRLECSVCLETYRDPRSLACRHTFCLECLSQEAQGSVVKCPICRTSHTLPNIGVAGLPKDLTIQGFVDLLAASRAWASPTAEKATCHQHPGRQLLFFCESASCDQLVCDICISSEHKPHLWSAIALIEEKQKKIVGTLVGEVQAICSHLDEVVNSMDAHEADLKAQTQSAEAKIEQTMQTILTAVEERKKHLIFDLRSTSDEKLLAVRNRKEGIRKFLNFLNQKAGLLGHLSKLNETRSQPSEGFAIGLEINTDIVLESIGNCGRVRQEAVEGPSSSSFPVRGVRMIPLQPVLGQINTRGQGVQDVSSSKLPLSEFYRAVSSVDLGVTAAEFERSALFPDGNLLAVARKRGHGDCIMQVYDTGTGRKVRDLGDPVQGMTELALSGDGNRLAFWTCVGAVWTLRVCNVDSGKKLMELEKIQHYDKYRHLSISSDGQRISAAIRGSVWVWDVETGCNVGGSSFSVIIDTCCLSHDGSWVAVGVDEEVKILDYAKNQVLRVLRGCGREVHVTKICITKICITQKDSHIISLTQNGTIRIWDVESGEQVQKLKFDCKRSSVIELICNDRFLTVRPNSNAGDVTYMGEMHIWEMSSGCLVIQSNFGKSNFPVGISRDGRFLVTANTSLNVRNATPVKIIVWEAADARIFLGCG
mmetsp:Transcript_26895/g.45052  ORF Transcript_26895/g.45052 Transcript_26895/m.45052 type:complete len:655 (-) Transcript_26895:293-2257(-)